MLMLLTQLHFIFFWRVNNDAQHTICLIPQPATLDVGTIQSEKYGCWYGYRGSASPSMVVAVERACTARVHIGGSHSFITPQVTDNHESGVMC